MKNYLYRTSRLRTLGKDDITPQDVQEFCSQLRDAIESTNLDGKTDNEIFGEIYTRTRTNIWYTMRDDCYIKQLFLTNMKITVHNMPTKVQSIVNYVMNQVLRDELPKDDWGDAQLAVASMNRLTKQMTDAAGLSESLSNQLMEINKTLKENMEEVNV